MKIKNKIKTLPKSPRWLTTEQVRILTLGDEEPPVNYAKAIMQELRAKATSSRNRKTTAIVSPECNTIKTRSSQL